MKLHALFLGLLALSCAACGNASPPEVFIGSGGGHTGQGGGGGSGNGPVTNPEGIVFPGTLARYPLAVTNDGHAWLFAGTYSSLGPGYPGTWPNAQLWKVDSTGTIEIDMLLDADGFDVEPKAIHATPNGDVLLLGQVTRQPNAGQILNIGGQPVSFPFASAVFVAKIDSKGQLQWAKVINGDVGKNVDGQPGSLLLLDVDTDATGRVYAAAALHGTADFGGGPVTHDDALLFILSPEGKYIEHRVFLPKDTAFLDLAVEPSGNFWLARSSLFLHSRIEHFAASGLLTFESEWPECWVDAMAFAPDSNGGFFSMQAEDVAEHCPPLSMQHDSTAGGPQWKVEDGNYYGVQPTLVPSSPGHAWLSVRLEGTFGIGSTSLTGTNIDDILIAEMDEQGNASKMATYGGPGVDEVVQMGVDASGMRTVTGYFADQIDFGSGLLKNTTGAPRAIFLTRLNP